MRLLTKTPVEYFTRNQIDAVKGILILSVMVGHLRSLAGVNLEIFQFVYNYHVLGFLLLPFLYPLKKINKAQICDWLARFYVPFTVFFIFYATLNIYFFKADISCVDFIKGYFIATPNMIDVVTGSEILWFLPHIFLVFITCSFVLLSNVKPLIVISIALLLHVSVGFISEEYASYIPLTGSNVAYLFFLGYALRLIILSLKNSGHKFVLIFALLFCGGQFLSVWSQNTLGYTGINLFEISNIKGLIFSDVLIIFGMLFFLYFKFLSKINFLCWMGRHSLIIFLVHQPFLYISWKALEHVNGLANTTEIFLIYAVVSLVCALILSALCVLFFKYIPKLNTVIFPRNVNAFITTFFIGKK